MDLIHTCKIIEHLMFQQSQHSEIMTIIYLINHSASKLFNQVWNQNQPLIWIGWIQIPIQVSSFRRLNRYLFDADQINTEGILCWISLLVNSKEWLHVDMLLILRGCRRTSDPVLFRQRRTAADPSLADFSLDVLALKPSGFCNLRENQRK